MCPRGEEFQAAHKAWQTKVHHRRAHPDLNQGPADLQSAALTTELCTHMLTLELSNPDIKSSKACLGFMHGHATDPGRTRACNLWFRRPTPYPLGHRALDACQVLGDNESCKQALARHGWYPLRAHCCKGTWCSGITSASHAEGPGFKSQCVHYLCQQSPFRQQAVGKRPRADLSRDRWIQSPEC